MIQTYIFDGDYTELGTGEYDHYFYGSDDSGDEWGAMTGHYGEMIRGDGNGEGYFAGEGDIDDTEIL